MVRTHSVQAGWHAHSVMIRTMKTCGSHCLKQSFGFGGGNLRHTSYSSNSATKMVCNFLDDEISSFIDNKT